MKKLCTHVLIALVGLVSKSYAQEGFYYQAMLRNSDGSPVKTQPVTLELSILKQNEVSYHESHELTTSENGFIHATFGSGLVHLGALDTIDWSEALSLKESIALNGSMLISSIKPILKTPRAYVADKALSIAPNAISDEHLSTNAQISFEKLKISRADIESLGIIDTDTDTTYEVGDNGLSEKNFTAELKTKLEGIEAASDVTDTQNVVAALTAGTNISIAADGTISATSGTSYSAGSNITINDGVISASSGTSYSVGDGGLTEKNFTAALKTKLEGIEAASDVTDTQNVVAALTAGTNISIAADGTISATDTDTTYSAGNGLTLTGTTLAIDNTVVTNTYSGTVAASAFSGDGSGLTNLQNLSDNSVSTVKIQDASITPAKLANAAVESSALADGSVTSSKLVDNGITNSKIADGVITAAKIDGGVNYQTAITRVSETFSGADSGYSAIVTNSNTIGAANSSSPLMLYGVGTMYNGNSVIINIDYDLTSDSLVFITRTNENMYNYNKLLYAVVDPDNNSLTVSSMNGNTGPAATTFNFMIVNFN
jgi:hypothetical protein